MINWPQSFDVWDPAPAPDEGERELPVWLGYVAREHVQDHGLMWSAYRATSYGQHISNAVVHMDDHDTPDDAQQQIRDFWEVRDVSGVTAPKNALTPDAFAHKYGEILSMGLWGARWIGSAIVRGRGRTRKYIAYDHRTKDYVVESI